MSKIRCVFDVHRVHSSGGFIERSIMLGSEFELGLYQFFGAHLLTPKSAAFHVCHQFARFGIFTDSTCSDSVEYFELLGIGHHS